MTSVGTDTGEQVKSLYEALCKPNLTAIQNYMNYVYTTDEFKDQVKIEIARAFNEGRI